MNYVLSTWICITKQSTVKFSERIQEVRHILFHVHWYLKEKEEREEEWKGPILYIKSTYFGWALR